MGRIIEALNRVTGAIHDASFGEMVDVHSVNMDCKILRTLLLSPPDIAAYLQARPELMREVLGLLGVKA